MAERIEFTTETWGDWKQRTEARRLRFALIMTGGTIVMVPNKKGILIPAENPQQLIRFATHLQDYADIEIIPLMNKDSSNMENNDWTTIAESVIARYHQYDGFLITHGTDTLAYTASAMRFALGKRLYNPVVFTAAQSPIIKDATDAVINLEDSVRILEELRRRQTKGVVVVAGRQIHNTVRVLKSDEVKYDFLRSPVTGPVGYTTAQGIHWERTKDLSFVRPGTDRSYLPFQRLRKRLRSGRWETNPNTEYMLKIPETSRFASGILSIRLEPNLGREALEDILLRPNKPFKAIILNTHGAGNPPDWSLDVIQKLLEQQIPVLITPPESGMGTAVVYATAAAAKEMGAIQTGDMVPPVISTKLSWLLAHNKSGLTDLDFLAREIPRNYFGEITE